MAKDPRKMSAFESGMRGRETPKPAVTKSSPKRVAGKSEGKAGNDDVRESAAGKFDAFTSGMRGKEVKGHETFYPRASDGIPAGTRSAKGAPQRRAEDRAEFADPTSDFSDVEESDLPEGSDGNGQTMSSDTARSRAEEAYKLGSPGSNLEAAAAGDEPWAEEDDTHINIRVPKATMKKKPGLQGS